MSSNAYNYSLCRLDTLECCLSIFIEIIVISAMMNIGGVNPMKSKWIEI